MLSFVKNVKEMTVFFNMQFTYFESLNKAIEMEQWWVSNTDPDPDAVYSNPNGVSA